MNKTTIFTKTAKGLREASGKTSLVSGDVRRLLKDIDGKSTIRHLLKTHGFSAGDLKDILTQLLDEDFIREVQAEAADETRRTATPSSATPSSRAAPENVSGEDLDFTAFTMATGAMEPADERTSGDEAEAGQHAPVEIEQRRQALRQAEEEARRAAEEAAQREARAQAQRQAEEEARRVAEETAQREADERSRREEEARVRKLAEEKAERDAEELARHDDEIRRRRDMDERAAALRAQAAAAGTDNTPGEAARREAAAWAQRATARAVAARSETAGHPVAPPVGAAGKTVVDKPARASRARRLVVVAAVAVPLLAVAAVHVMPFTGRIEPLQQAASRILQQPVSMGNVHVSLFPPHFILDDVTIGTAGQIKAPRVKMGVGMGAIFGGEPSLGWMTVERPVLNDEGLAWLVLPRPGGANAAPVSGARIDMTDVRIESTMMKLPPLAVRAEMGGGLWQKAVLATADKSLIVDMTAHGDAVDVAVTAASLAVPCGSTMVLSDFNASGIVSDGALAVTEFKSRLHGGLLGGSVKIARNGQQWIADGELVARQIDTAQMLPGMFEGDRLEGRATFSRRADDVALLFADMRLTGSFLVRQGTLLGIDLGRMIQNGDVLGKTEFGAMSGEFVAADGSIGLQNLHLSAGNLSASGSAEVDAGNALRARLLVELRLPAETRRVALGLAGTTRAPEWKRRGSGLPN